MIPILYKAKEADFTHNGVGPLWDAISCIVTEERNGIFEAELQYPVEGPLFDYIQEDSIFKAKPNDTAEPQLFRIYKSAKPFDGVVTYSAEHISYELSGNPLESVTVANATATHALNAVLSAAMLEHEYSAVSDIETLNSTALSLVSIRAALGGVEGSILDTYGGEYEFDNFNIKLHKHRGRETGIKIAYGKNLTDFKQDKNISEVYTAVFPYAKYTPQPEEGSEETPEEVVVTLPEKIIYSDKASLYARVRVLMKDFSQEFGDGEEITEAKLRSKAQSYVNTSGFDVPAVNITVSFVNLWQSPEYAKYALLERVNLCDTVTVEFPKYKVTAAAKVIKTQYDVLKERYNTIQLGDAKANFADTFSRTAAGVEAVRQEIKKQATAQSVKLAQAIAKATALITGQNGGYVVLNPSENPQEILIMDTPDIGTAVNVWRWNSAGLGHSQNGYNGPFELAITADGAIVADFITAGTIRGALIEADSIKSSAISQSYKSEVTSEITGATNEVEQAFVAADEQLRSLIATATSELTGDILQTERQISELVQTVENLSLSFTTQYTGGINNIANSSALNGVSSDWVYSGTVQALQNNDTKNNTLSGACFWITNGTLSQDVAVIAGTKYTLTLKARKSAVQGYIKAISGGSEIEVLNTAEAADWTEYTVTFVTASNLLTVEAYSYADFLHVADIMLTEGDAKQRWTPAPNEIYTTDVKIDRRGIHITNTESETSTIINNVEFAVLYRSEKVITVNKDTTILTKAKVVQELTVGRLKTVNVEANNELDIESGVDEILLD